MSVNLMLSVIILFENEASNSFMYLDKGMSVQLWPSMNKNVTLTESRNQTNGVSLQ